MAIGRMSGHSSGVAAKSDINITPYIDILLVLLIIFMVIQPTTQYDLRARVPRTRLISPKMSSSSPMRSSSASPRMESFESIRML